MHDPVLINLTRGNLVESFHRGALCAIDRRGNTIVSLGDIERPVYPRSAIKALQALPLVESGAADAMGLEDKELALACASHSGEEVHVETAKAMLAKIGLSADALACGPQWPLGPAATRALAAANGKPTPLHNNCSGKHAGMLILATHIGATTSAYEKPDHPVQEMIRQAIEGLTGETPTMDKCGIDGCSAPTWAVSLSGFARAYSRIASRDGLPAERSEAARRLVHACTSEPLMVEGTGRFSSGVMLRLGKSAFVKGGAEGVYCAAFPEQGLGMALKINDGAKRGAEATAAHVIAAALASRVKNAGELYDMDIANWRGTRVGEIQPSQDLLEAIKVLQP